MTNNTDTQTRDLSCDMLATCEAPVAYLGNKGYVYCETHGIKRRQSGYERTRKLKPAELSKLRAGETLERY